MDKFRAMQVFVAVVEQGSLSAAANELGISAVMVGKHIQQLESLLNTRLIERTTRRQSVSRAGASYFENCKKVLEQVRWAESSVESLQLQPRGLLRVSAPINLGSMLIAPLIARYLAQYPKVRLELILSNSRVDLIEDGFDLAIRTGDLGEAHFVAKPIGQYQLQLCASPQYLQQYGTPLSPADLSRHHGLTHLVWGNEWPSLVLQDDQIWPIKSRFASNDSQALRQAALNGAGIILQPQALLAEDIAAGRLIPLLQEHLPVAKPVHLIYLPDTRPRPKLSSLLDFLLAELPAKK
ncbi:LysR family transcriptional regulator [Iodobacter sp. HSC-16F04]|uniref:LysR family transcriptional regulator n=1 Tax=Iodobacter violaceini TaxID=3044271 RepID=A0ABX0KRE9_9NEIS|nr:LysR family transcriptional regulator [Iodobacter violacea]NHQ86492.1 LysR family transcriptional regulator [Iodobacter violacea]